MTRTAATAPAQVFVRMSDAVARTLADLAEEIGLEGFSALLPFAYVRKSGKGATLLVIVPTDEADRIVSFLRGVVDNRPKGFPIRPHRVTRALGWITEDMTA